ncbi:MAG TPA: GTPase Era [Candidatus Polarisedimenticolaceae bacterium]|nr:GTPase Era [Candidatus Polarisedimenticolaceae bacterium]
MSGKAGFVALFGWTNVGKSTLLNRLLGEKIAAVADVPQTTRTRILGALPLEDGGQVVFVDTPGLHEPKHALNRAMVETARRSLEGVDLAVLLVDAARGPGEGDRRGAHVLERAGVARIGVLNKIDRVQPKAKLLPMLEEVQSWGLDTWIPISALTGEGCDVLLREVTERLPEGEAPFARDFLTDQPERALAAEWIREKVLHHTRQEIPHATAVSVDSWKTREDGLLEIDATILVEREGQKAIVIGKGGALLKQIGSQARVELERFFEAKVMLRLWVRVAEEWREDRRTLRELGLEGDRHL